jgi:hypothetical protein
MKCMSCDMEINPKWSHAIDINVCPFCGQGIMEEHLKNLFSSLRQTMESLKDYPDQLNDWMLSNHNYIKTDSSNIKLYMPKGYIEEIKNQKDDEFEEQKIVVHIEPSRKSVIKMDNGHGQEQEVVVEKVQSEEKTNEFFKRAEAVKPNIDGFKSTTEKTQHLKAMAQQIKREGSTVINKAGLATHLPAEMIDSADPAAVAEYESIINGGEVQSSLPDNSGDDDIPSIVLNMANRSKGKVSDQDPTAELERLQSRQDASRRNFTSGGKGSFSRS